MLSQDKRQTIRIPSSRPVLLIINNRSIYATMTDFSLHGIGFMSSEDTPVHARVEVHFDVADTNGNGVVPFQFKAEVRHCMHISRENHIGVKLDMPTREYVDLFQATIAA